MSTQTKQRSVICVSRCAWTLYNFRRGQMSALLERGYRVTGAGSGGDGFEPKIEALGVPYTVLPIDRRAVNPKSDLKLLKTMYRLYRKQRPDIVHHFTIKPVIYGSIAARFARVPRIVNTVTGLGFVFSEDASPILRSLVERQYRFALSGSHFTFFQNEEDHQLFVDHRLVNPEKSGRLPGSGVNTSEFVPQPPVDGPVCFVMVARMLSDKGVYEYAEAARQVKAVHPDTRFLLVGGRDERNPRVVPENDLKQWVAEGTLEWTGEVEDVRPYVQQAHVAVLPSFYREGVPRSLLEAASMGKAVITTDFIGCKEVVENGATGLLVPIKNAAALAEAMLSLISSPERMIQMGDAGRRKMVREFDESVVIDKILDAYERDSH